MSVTPCQSSACKSAADQAGDVSAYAATLGSGIRGASAAQLGPGVWVQPEWSAGGGCGCKSGAGCGCSGGAGKRPAGKKKGCRKQGPGCASESCNQCADMAVEVINATAGLGDGIPRATMENILASKMNGGFVPGVGSFAAPSSPSRLARRSSGSGPASVDEIRDNFESNKGGSVTSRFEIPSSGGTNCQAATGCAAPAIQVHSEGDWIVLLGLPDLNVDIDSCSDTWEFFIRVAVNFLRYNEDIWRWILCLLSDDVANGKVELIDDMLTTGDFHVQCQDGTQAFWCQNPGPPNMITDPFWGTIYICANSPVIATLYEVWTCGLLAERLAALIDLSAILLHELLHAAWGPKDSRSGCSPVDALENTFIWACLQRFPAAGLVGCVTTLVDAGGQPKDTLFLGTSAGTQLDAGQCSECTESGTRVSVYCMKHPEECSDDGATVEHRDTETRS